MLNPGPPPENITVGAGPPLPQMKTSSRLVLHCNTLNTYCFSRAGHNGPHFCSQVSVKRSSCFQCWNAELSTLFFLRLAYEVALYLHSRDLYQSH